MLRNLKWQYNRIKSYVGRPRLLVQERVIVRDDADTCESPLFILGAHRSGTSLVRRMFNSHPDIACPPETFFIARYVAMLDDEMTRGGYEAFGMDGEAMRDDLARKAASLHEAFRRACGKAIWADKTPHYLSIAEGIDRLFAQRPRYILVRRHPLDIAHSIWKRGWRFNDIEDGFDASLEYVRESIEQLDAFERAHPDRCARLVYRDLCADPARELAAAMARIGLAYDAEMLEFGNRQHNYGLEDPVVRGKKTVDLSEGAWQGWSAQQRQRAVDVFGPAVLRLDFEVGGNDG